MALISLASASPLPIYTGKELRQLEAQAEALPEPPALMERAGLATADAAEAMLENAGGRPVLVLAGPGNNGGDGLVAARHLQARWHRVMVVLAGDPQRLPRDAAKAYEAWTGCGGEILHELPALGGFSLILDGLFGIGLERPVQGRYADWIDIVNRSGRPVLALDIPSGLNGDTGRVMGVAVRATRTVTFLGLKPGLLTLDGPDHCGGILADDLGLDLEAMLPAPGHTLQPGLLNVLPPRPRNSHKGSFGSVGILGGAPGMTGALLLAGRAALKLGAGRVYCAALGGRMEVDPDQPELMLPELETLLAMQHLNCLVVGPGLGQSEAARAILERALRFPLPLALDADALNLLAGSPELKLALMQRQSPTLLTPHPAEAARLLDCSTGEIQADRVQAALKLASEYRSPTVLKGVGSVCANPDGRWFVNNTGNSGLASAGMGDVLSGMLAAFLAQGLAAEEALKLAVYLHGLAADELVAEGTGPVGLMAGEVIQRARLILNRAVYRR
jgi:ADP-dependent NAD(P)H-hydrate dehydratase / NAD(P)H-hydrate epimerase